MNMKHHLINNLKRLKMPAVSENLEIREREAKEHNMGYLEFLSLLLQDEIANRESNILAKRIQSGNLDPRMTFESFNFKYNAEVLPSQTVRDLSTCHFIERNQSVVLCGLPGIGKTHIAHAIGHEICRRGYDAMFFKTHKLLQILNDKTRPRRVARLWKNCLHSKLLILDDFGFRRYDTEECEMLYSIADERLGKQSTIITSNRPVEDWYGVFPDPVIGGAILDRLVSGAIKLIIEKGKSYRKKGTGGLDEKKEIAIN